MASKETAAKTAIKKDVDLKGVKVVYIDSPETLYRAYQRRKDEGSVGDMGDMFVHLRIESNGETIKNLSQTLRILGKEDYDTLWKAYINGTEVDIVVRIDEMSIETDNCFFFLKHGDVSVDDLFKEPFAKHKRASEGRSAVDLLG